MYRTVLPKCEFLPFPTEKMAKDKDTKLVNNSAENGSSLWLKQPYVDIQPPLIRPMDDYRFSLYPAKYDPCVYSQIISSHHISEEQIRKLYADILSIRLKPQQCSKLTPAQLRPYSSCSNNFWNRILNMF